MKGIAPMLVFVTVLALASYANAQTEWTDMFTYWVMWPDVKEGALKGVFQDPLDP
jgi:hypothetical protein